MLMCVFLCVLQCVRCACSCRGCSDTNSRAQSRDTVHRDVVITRPLSGVACPIEQFFIVSLGDIARALIATLIHFHFLLIFSFKS
jgi:hypothetical protein